MWVKETGSVVFCLTVLHTGSWGSLRKTGSARLTSCFSFLGQNLGTLGKLDLPVMWALRARDAVRRHQIRESLSSRVKKKHKKTPLFSWFARFGLFRIFRTFDVNASGSVVYDNELQVGVETGSWMSVRGEVGPSALHRLSSSDSLDVFCTHCKGQSLSFPGRCSSAMVVRQRCGAGGKWLLKNRNVLPTSAVRHRWLYLCCLSGPVSRLCG